MKFVKLKKRVQVAQQFICFMRALCQTFSPSNLEDLKIHLPELILERGKRKQRPLVFQTDGILFWWHPQLILVAGVLAQPRAQSFPDHIQNYLRWVAGGIVLDATGVFGCIVRHMNKKFFAVLAGAAIAVTGCVKTVSDTHSFATTWSKDSVAGRYNRSVEQVYAASVAVIQANGVLIREFIPHDTTNSVRALEGKVNQRNVWIRVEGVDNKTTQVEVQSRGNWGGSDLDLTHELEKEIALQLAR